LVIKKRERNKERRVKRRESYIKSNINKRKNSSKKVSKRSFSFQTKLAIHQVSQISSPPKGSHHPAAATT